MAGGHPNIAQAWEAATSTVAVACGVDLAGLRAPSRGRGPRPPRELWEPKQIAVSVAVTLANCAYSDLGKLIGLHRDTVASHCAEIRERAAADEDFGQWVQALTNMAAGPAPVSQRTDERRRAGTLALLQLEARVAALEAALGFHPTAATHPTSLGDHGNVIKIPRKAAR